MASPLKHLVHIIFMYIFIFYNVYFFYNYLIYKLFNNSSYPHIFCLKQNPYIQLYKRIVVSLNTELLVHVAYSGRKL